MIPTGLAMSDNLMTLMVAALGSGALTALVGGSATLAREWSRRRDLAKSRGAFDVIEDVHKIYKVLTRLLADTDADSVVLIRAENGGKVPQVGGELNLVAMYEVRGSAVTSFEPGTKYRLDADGVRMLVDVNRNGSLIVLPSDFKGSTIGDSMEAFGLSVSHMHDVFEAEGAYYVINMGFGVDPGRNYFKDGTYRTLVNMGVEAVRDIFERNDGQIG